MPDGGIHKIGDEEVSFWEYERRASRVQDNSISVGNALLVASFDDSSIFWIAPGGRKIRSRSEAINAAKAMHDIIDRSSKKQKARYFEWVDDLIRRGAIKSSIT